MSELRNDIGVDTGKAGSTPVPGFSDPIHPDWVQAPAATIALPAKPVALKLSWRQAEFLRRLVRLVPDDAFDFAVHLNGDGWGIDPSEFSDGLEKALDEQVPERVEQVAA